MRGPEDEAIDARSSTPGEVSAGGDGGDRTGAALAERAPRPPGGKPLLRLLALLGQAGLEESATEATMAAVPESQRATFVERSLGSVAIPPGIGGNESDGSGVQTAEDAAAAAMRAADFLGVPTTTGPQWRSLGPTTVPNGQTYGASRVNVSGRVSCIAVDPSNAAHVLVGAANGGVWESFNRGATWAPRTDYAATLAVGAIAFDPSNPKLVYCGLGEGNWWSWLGTGVLRSSDGGTTWTSLATAPFVGQGFFDFAVDPSDGKQLFAATNVGLYVSTNGGTSWTQRHSAATWAVSTRTGRHAEVLAASSDGVQRSTDGGITFTTVTLPGSPGDFTRLAVAISASDPTIAYAWGTGGPIVNDAPTAYLWRRAANTWTAVAVPPGVATGQSWYDWFLAVSPDNANQVYCGAISVHRGTLTGSTWAWVDIASKPTGDSIHPDQHAIAFEPGNAARIYVGCDGGMFTSPDRGITWAHLNNGLVITEFEYLAQNLGSSRWLIGGTQDNGTERWLGSPVWEHVADGDGGDCSVNRSNPNVVVHTYYGMSPERSTTGGGWNSWVGIAPPVPAGEQNPFYPPFEASASGGDTVAMAGASAYVSRDNGTNWTRLTYPSAGTASGMFIPNPDTVLVGLADGRILRTTWSGTAWTAVALVGTPRANAAISDIAVDPGNAARIWATSTRVGGGRVFLSTNTGAAWTNVSSNLPDLSITAIALDPRNSNRAWVSASLGVYQTLDGGRSWSAFAAGLPNAYVGDLVYHQHSRVLRAGLRNRGAWEIPVDGWLTNPICGTQWTGQLAAGETRRWFTFNWPAVWHVVWTVMPTTVRNGAPEVRWNVQVERASAEYATYWITVTNLTASPVSFEGRYNILSYY